VGAPPFTSPWRASPLGGTLPPMTASAASRARADRLRERIAAIRKEHSVATARARMNGTEIPPYSQLGALGVADHLPAMVQAQDVNRHLLASLDGLLLLIEQEQERARATDG
jgi:hypothetical protein